MSSDTPQTAPLIHGRLAAVLAEVDAITKGRQNQAQGFKFRGIDDVYNALHPLFGKHQIYVRPELVDQKQTERPTSQGKTQIHAVVRMRYHFTTIDGSSVAVEMMGEAADSGDKSLGKAAQYAYKVALLQAFLIPTEEEKDPDGQSTEWGAQQRPERRRDTKPGNFREQYGDLPKAKADPPPDWMTLIARAKTPAALQGVRTALTAALRAGTAPDPLSAPGKMIGDALDAKESELATGGGR